MKILLTLYSVISIVSVYSEAAPANSEEQNSDAKIKHCAAENDIDTTTIVEYIDKNWAMPDKPEVQCFLACLLKKDGMMNDDGTLTEKFVNDENHQLCKNPGGNGACEIAFKAIECLFKNHPNEALSRLVNGIQFSDR